jgi:hypothetical protein
LVSGFWFLVSGSWFLVSSFIHRAVLFIADLLGWIERGANIIRKPLWRYDDERRGMVQEDFENKKR